MYRRKHLYWGWNAWSTDIRGGGLDTVVTLHYVCHHDSDDPQWLLDPRGSPNLPIHFFFFNADSRFTAYPNDLLEQHHGLLSCGHFIVCIHFFSRALLHQYLDILVPYASIVFTALFSYAVWHSTFWVGIVSCQQSQYIWRCFRSPSPHLVITMPSRQCAIIIAMSAWRNIL